MQRLPPSAVSRSSFETIVDHQVDNHLSDGVYPVLVSKREEAEPSSLDGSRRGGGSGGGGRDAQPQQTPFLQISIIKEVNQSTNTAHYDYVAFRCDGLVGIGYKRATGRER